MSKLRMLLLLAISGLSVASTAHAAEWVALVYGADGKPLKDAVVSLDGALSGASPAPAIMDQIHMQFEPRVLAVRTGSQVTFPNSDDIRHQVYSFSPAKRFELRLYHGTPSDPVIFDKPGLVVLGCNIHDNMVGYIYVTDAPRVGVSDAQGRVAFDVPAGTYSVTLWHPDIPGAQPVTSEQAVVGDTDVETRFDLDVQPVVAPAAPANGFEALFRNTLRDAKP